MLRGQDLSCLSAADVRTVRSIIADREFYKAAFEESERQRAALVTARDNWRSLYEAEKLRADIVQGGQVAELKAEVKDVRAALDTAKDQMALDRQKIGEQNAEIIRLKSSRKWYFGLGAAAGAVGGYLVGKNQDRIVTAATGNLAPSRFNFGAKFNF